MEVQKNEPQVDQRNEQLPAGDGDRQPPMKGVAPIKKEFLVFSKGQIINWDHTADNGSKTAEEASDGQEKRAHVDDRDADDGERGSKRFKLRGQNKNKLRYKVGQKNVWSRGRRGGGGEDKDQGEDVKPRNQIDRANRMCLRFVEREGFCPYETTCRFSHDLYKIYKANESELNEFKEPCFIYKSYGRCQFGTACLFAASHIKILEDKQKAYNMIDHQRWSLDGGRESFIEKYNNKLEYQFQHKLRKKTYDFGAATKAMTAIYAADAKVETTASSNGGQELGDSSALKESTKSEKTEESSEPTELKETSEPGEASEPKDTTESNDTHDQRAVRIGAILVDEYLKGRDFERKKIDFTNKLYLAPLTTVGNLPFRRLCKKYSCDITCAEMSLCSALLNGNPQEWSHMRRHESEDIFGVQITGPHPDQVTKTVKLISDICDTDFIDINCGCPTEWIYQSGAGAGLMNRQPKLRKMIAGAAMVSKVPITIKMRAGVMEDKNTAHNLINSVINPFTSKYIGAITVHGRSRSQRYTKSADWNYINECGRVADGIPLIGSGDCISWQDYHQKLSEYPNISGVLIARGALLAPWLFTEIKERRTWDISSKERLDIVKDFVNFGLDHWGSDATGIENCRRYLLEWLSFACRYIPVGLLEVLPQRINDRPPMFKGRDELETLLSSPSASDWVKISEMFLGKVPDDFKFLPKHKSNAYESVVEG